MHHNTQVTSATELKNDAASLKAQWWDNFFEGTEDALVLCDSKGIICNCNLRAAQFLAIPKNYSDGKKSILNYLTRETSNRVLELLKRKNGGQVTIPAITIISAEHIQLIADLQVSLLGDGYSLIVIRDASRRWRMESHVQRLLAAVEVSRDVIFMTDSEYRIVFANPSFQNVTGYTLEESLGRTADFLRAPESLAKYDEYLRCIESGYDWEGELINVKSDGIKYPVAASISPIFNNQGHFLGYAAFERDITDRKKLESELIKERNYVNSIINSLDAAVYSTDKEFRLLHINNGWKNFPQEHGFLTINTPPETGQNLLDYIKDQKKREELRAIFESVLVTGEPREIRASTPGGKHWVVKMSAWNRDNGERGLIYMVSDQTKFHELQRQLYQAQKMETVGSLAAGVAHDFNNLLMAIQVNTSVLLLKNNLENDVLAALKEIEVAAQRAGSITRQLLSFSRPSDDQETIVDFNTIVTEARQLFARSLRPDVTVKFTPADPPPMVLINTTRAHQLLLNLFINAQDAMPHGGTITVINQYRALTHEQSVKAHRPAGTIFLCCSVADTGTGIPPEIINKVFEPFFTTKEKGKGTGLGLSIVHSVVSQAGGFIELESQVGLGTTFYIYLPLSAGDSKVQPVKKKQKILRGTGRILVVDDLDLVLEVAHRFLTLLGYEVLLAHSADEAMDILLSQEKPIDLLFTDYNMTGKNGLELIMEVREKWPDMKFILSSGYIGENQQRQVEQFHNIKILNKPYNVREAAELIASMLSPDKDKD